MIFCRFGIFCSLCKASFPLFDYCWCLCVYFSFSAIHGLMERYFLLYCLTSFTSDWIFFITWPSRLLFSVLSLYTFVFLSWSVGYLNAGLHLSQGWGRRLWWYYDRQPRYCTWNYLVQFSNLYSLTCNIEHISDNSDLCVRWPKRAIFNI